VVAATGSSSDIPTSGEGSHDYREKEEVEKPNVLLIDHLVVNPLKHLVEIKPPQNILLLIKILDNDVNWLNK